MPHESHPETALALRPALDIPEYLPPSEPSWDRARGLANQMRKSIRVIIELGAELQGLRDQYFTQYKFEIAGPGRGKIKPASQGVTPVLGKRPKAEVERVSIHAMRGWQAKVREEMGICHMTALRMIERAEHVALLQWVATGEEIQYPTARGELSEVHPTPEMRALAAKALESVANGTVNPQRAWAGVMGEGTRRGHNPSAPKHRAETDFSVQIRAALVALRNALPHWSEIDPHTRADLETIWHRGDFGRKNKRLPSVVSLLPETWVG